MEFSKILVAVAIIINLIIIIFTVSICRETNDTSALGYLAIGDGGALATAVGFYFWKSKNENRYKHCQRIMNEWAEKYGVDTAIQLADTILRD